MLERLFFSAGQGTPWTSPKRAGAGGCGKGVWAFLLKLLAPQPKFGTNKNMDGWLNRRMDGPARERFTKDWNDPVNCSQYVFSIYKWGTGISTTHIVNKCNNSERNGRQHLGNPVMCSPYCGPFTFHSSFFNVDPKWHLHFGIIHYLIHLFIGDLSTYSLDLGILKHVILAFSCGLSTSLFIFSDQTQLFTDDYSNKAKKKEASFMIYRYIEQWHCILYKINCYSQRERIIYKVVNNLFQVLLLRWVPEQSCVWLTGSANDTARRGNVETRCPLHVVSWGFFFFFLCFRLHFVISGPVMMRQNG